MLVLLNLRGDIVTGFEVSTPVGAKSPTAIIVANDNEMARRSRLLKHKKNPVIYS